MGDTRPVPLEILSACPRALREWVSESHDDMRRANKGWDARIGTSCSFVHSIIMSDPEAMELVRRSANGEPANWIRATYLVAAVTEWSKSQSIYAFDPDAEEALCSTSPGQLPTELLWRLPYTCVYVKASSGGFFALMDHGRLPSGETAFFLILVGGDERGWFHVELPLGKTIAGIAGMPGVDGDIRPERASMVADVEPLVSLLMYLCSEEPDITSKPSPMNEARIRRGKSPYHPTIHHVGYRIGAAFRKAKAEREASQGTGGHGASPAPHMRRAHWHTYWVGKENTPQRRQVVKWLPPIPVNVKSDDDIIPTIHRVSAGR